MKYRKHKDGIYPGAAAYIAETSGRFYEENVRKHMLYRFFSSVLLLKQNKPA